MSKRSPYRGNQCFNCGTQCVPCTDNFGQPYQGCPRCVIKLPDVGQKMSKLDEWRRLATEAYDHAKLLNRHELAALLDVIEAAQSLTMIHRANRMAGSPTPALEAFEAALAKLEREGR
jgi:hypothetical protein